MNKYVNSPIEKKNDLLVFALIALAAVTCLTACDAKTSSAEAPAKTEAQSVAKVVFLYNSACCKCEKQRNKDALESLDYFMKNPDSRPMTRIDVSQSPDKLKFYQKQTRISFMPVLLGLDENGRVVEKVEGIFENKQKELETIFF